MTHLADEQAAAVVRRVAERIATAQRLAGEIRIALRGTNGAEATCRHIERALEAHAKFQSTEEEIASALRAEAHPLIWTDADEAALNAGGLGRL